jgi:hypothetical protein
MSAARPGVLAVGLVDRKQFALSVCTAGIAHGVFADARKWNKAGPASHDRDAPGMHLSCTAPRSQYPGQVNQSHLAVVPRPLAIAQYATPGSGEPDPSVVRRGANQKQFSCGLEADRVAFPSVWRYSVLCNGALAVVLHRRSMAPEVASTTSRTQEPKAQLR